MSEHASDFIAHLQGLARRDRGALSALRRSLGFEPGSYPPAFPAVERFVAQDSDSPAQRQALYLTAALFAMHPVQVDRRSLASALGLAMQNRGSESLEKRFIALLGADAPGLPNHLRQAVSLLAADDLGYDHAALLGDLARLLQPWSDETRDRVRQRWARDFYRAGTQPTSEAAPDTAPTRAIE